MHAPTPHAAMIPSRPRVSVVIVSWNALDLVKKCLPSVVDTDYPDLEIVFADNASTDGTAEWIAEQFPSVKIVRHPENWAFCRGNNQAIPHTSGKYVVLLNNDVEVPAHWLTPLVAAAEADDRVAAVQPKLLQYEHRTRFEYAGGSGGFLDRLGYPFTRGRIFDTLEADTGQYDDARDIFWASGAAVLLRRSALDEVGLLDERFVMHMEEIDLCWRLQRAGYRIRVEPDSEVYHIGGGSLPASSPRKTYLNFRNNLLMLYKNLPPDRWADVFRKRLVLDGAAAARSVFAGKPLEGSAILQAYAAAHKMSKIYAAERPATDSAFVLPSYQGSVVSDYFLHRRRHFSDLPAERFVSA